MIADEQGLDLVEISPKAIPPVCKVMDYKKFLFEQKKREKFLKSKTSKVVVKEIRFGPNTDDHDYEFKKKHAIKFLSDGAKLKAFVFFRGRSILYKDKGEILLLRLAQELEEYGTVEQLPKLESKKMIMIITPKKIDKLREMPKMKTKSSAKKRFKLTGSGKIKRKHAFKSHILTKKSKKRKLALTHSTLVHKSDTDNIKRQLRLK